MTANRARRRLWDGYAVVYDFIWDSPVTSALAGAVAGLVGAADPVVDLGCGTGLASAAVTGQVIGVDASPAMLRRAAGRLGRTIQAQAHQTGLPDNAAGGAVLANLLHVCDQPEAVLAEALRLVKPGGPVVVTWPAPAATIRSVAQAQRRSGWPLWRALLAGAAALAVGLAAALLRLPRRTDRQVRRLLENGGRTDGIAEVKSLSQTCAAAQCVALLTAPAGPPRDP
ncbi:MAG: class I SAM-dependent methyltransferase [Bifidobacteriaceae bacterium]|jgi:SAM-dependent methyltransferase|nr:class I SAM-dependent methyltransferase [Bifidobacteriaceae bacterium]